MRGAERRTERDRRLMAWQAQIVGVLAQVAPRHHPGLDELCSGRRRARSADEMLLYAQMWDAAVNTERPN